MMTTADMQISPTKSAVLKIGASASEHGNVHHFIGTHKIFEPHEVDLDQTTQPTTKPPRGFNNLEMTETQ